MEQNRFRSPVVWASLASQIIAILIILGVIDTGLGDTIDGVVAAVLELLTSFGVLNNPTSKTTM